MTSTSSGLLAPEWAQNSSNLDVAAIKGCDERSNSIPLSQSLLGHDRVANNSNAQSETNAPACYVGPSQWELAMWCAMIVALLVLSVVAVTNGSSFKCEWVASKSGGGNCTGASGRQSAECAALGNLTDADAAEDCRNGRTEPLLTEPSEVLAVVATALAFIFSTEGSGYPRMRAVYR